MLAKATMEQWGIVRVHSTYILTVMQCVCLNFCGLKYSRMAREPQKPQTFSRHIIWAHMYIIFQPSDTAIYTFESLHIYNICICYVLSSTIVFFILLVIVAECSSQMLPWEDRHLNSQWQHQHLLYQWKDSNNCFSQLVCFHHCMIPSFSLLIATFLLLRCKNFYTIWFPCHQCGWMQPSERVHKVILDIAAGRSVTDRPEQMNILQEVPAFLTLSTQ